MSRKLILYPFLTVILLAPLPFAANRPWSWSLLSLLVGLLVIMEALFSRPDRRRNRFLLRMTPGILLAALVVGWIVVQTLAGVPADWLHPLWSETALALSMDVQPTISLDTEATLDALTRLLSYCGVFWIAARLGRDPGNAQFILGAFVLASCLYAAYGLLVYFADLKSILWYRKWAYKDDLTSTFVNRNTYATFAGLGLIASVALLARLLGRGLHGQLTVRAMLLEFAEGALARTWLPMLGIFLTAFALLLSHSRGGLLSTGVALLVLFLALSYTQAVSRKFGLLFSAVIVSFSIGVFVVAGDAVDVRLATTSLHTSMRDDVYARIVEIIPLNPYLGTGYGTFEQGFMAYKTYALSSATWDKAHNSYLELAFELGVPAALAVFGLFLWLACVFVCGLMRRNRRREFPAIGLAATALSAAHALVDFSLQIPGFTVCYAMLAGVSWAQSWPTPRRTARESR